MITERQALDAIRVLSAAYPRHPVEPDVVALYVQAFQRFADPDALRVALDNHIHDSSWFPTVHECVEQYQVVARARMAAAQSAEQERAITRGVLPGMPAAPAEYGVEMVDVLRTALAETLAGKRIHRHVPGVSAAQTCPTCSHADDIGATVAARVRQLREARGLAAPHEGQVTWACLRCHDAEWVPVGGSDLWKPCPECNRTASERWEGGHWRPGHTCMECEGVRRGKQPDYA